MLCKLYKLIVSARIQVFLVRAQVHKCTLYIVEMKYQC